MHNAKHNHLTARGSVEDKIRIAHEWHPANAWPFCHLLEPFREAFDPLDNLTNSELKTFCRGWVLVGRIGKDGTKFG